MRPLIAWLALAGPIWGLAGSAALPRRYRRHGRDPRLARPAGALVGLSLGLPGVVALWWRLPRLRRWWSVAAPAAVLALELLAAFRLLAPDNSCVRSPGYVADQLGNGLLVGAVIATAAIGLTLIFSVLGVVSFTHGQLVMAGGVASYLLLGNLWHVQPLLAIPLVGVMGFAAGAIIDRMLLTPLHRGRVDRPDEYAILVTFGFGIFLQYALLGVLGPTSGLRTARYTDTSLLGLHPGASAFTVGPLRVDTNLLVAGIVGLVLCTLLAVFLRYTWLGRSLRAVSENPQAASVAGVNADRSFTLAFALGGMLAAMAGATLVPVLVFPVPDIAGQMSIRSFVVVVLGGLGSVPGAFLGGLFVGAVEALGAGCYPDPSKGAVYQSAFGLVIFALVLLARPQGFFGRAAR
ncbi:MAG TPA: branched-chain amino acid ABC transporter permease [Actinomycetes bacterium]|nr:branched-chain amino acid ABC transporter permease [Actinomycetes bacterium]